MKKLLLAAAAVSAMSLSATAQTRMTLHEEFTGENCGPCAATNPGFWTLCNSTSPTDNPSKLIHIAYMEPIPTSGWFYLRSQAVNDARASYYSITSAPSGKYDGTAAGSGHPASFTQANIDAEALVASPFNITVTNSWNATYDTVVTNVSVTCVAAVSGTLYMRAALVQTMDFNTPPGSNGETHFENVVQDMYPSAMGTALATSWTVGMTQSYTLRGKVPSFVEKGNSPYMVVWIQDDASKNIHQAAKSTPLPPVPYDAAVSGVTSSDMSCVANGPYSFAHSVTVKNTGSTTLTSADIYYSVDGGTLASAPWTGSLAAGASTTVTMPAVSVTVAGAMYHYVYDSVANPNGMSDQSVNNNANAKSFFLESTNGLTMPFTTSFESTDGGKFYLSDMNSNGESWGTYTSSSGLGHTGTNAAGFEAYVFASGESEVITLPEVTTSATSEMTFYEAYCQYDATTNDKLEVVYSTDCGATWTSLWNQAGSTLATTAISTSLFVPTSAQYAQRTVSLSTVPTGAIIGFRATSDYGNNIWVDDVDIHATSGVAQVAGADMNASVFPNPAKDAAKVSFTLAEGGNVQVNVMDAVGRTVAQVANGNMGAGAHELNVNTASLAAGLYSVVISTDNGTQTLRLSIAK